MSPEKVPAVVIGAGVVGCAAAHELAKRSVVPVVVERGPRIAEGVTSRNSGVVHAGLHYVPGSLKALSCVRGNRLVYEWCAARGVPHKKTGKWIVGGRDDAPAVEELLANAAASGVVGLRLGASGELAQLAAEGVRAHAAVFSAETGIVDAFELTRSLEDAATGLGAKFVMNAAVEGIERLAAGGFRVSTTRGELDTDLVVNAAGLHADEVARLAGVGKYRIHPWRGDYFFLKRYRHGRLIYPVRKKDAPGLGIHLTVALDGSCRLGPDATLVESKTDFAPPGELEAKRRRFFEAARAYLPDLELDELSYDSCGIRPKLRGPGDTQEADFVVRADAPGFVNLIGLESPGLTAALDLAERAAKLALG